MTEETYWDKLAKTPQEKDLLKKLRRTKLGKLCEFLYNDEDEWGAPEDTFASEVVYRVGYEIGHWYQDLNEGCMSSNEKYPDGITPAQINTAKKWIYEAEKVLGTGRQMYFGGDF